MSRKINVNPDHYKVAGRERQGENIIQERQKQEFSRTAGPRNRSKKRGRQRAGR